MYRVSFDLPQHEHSARCPPGHAAGPPFVTLPATRGIRHQARLWRPASATFAGSRRARRRGQHRRPAGAAGASRGLERLSDERAQLGGGRNRARVPSSRRERVTAGPHDVVRHLPRPRRWRRTGPEGLRPAMFAVDPLYIPGVPAIERVIIEGPYTPPRSRRTPSRRATSLQAHRRRLRVAARLRYGFGEVSWSSPL